ncbi:MULTISPECIES: hypothetical protein [Cyanophyceae]|uniref:hypothetical protein n=1 Tax=Cyanophyceae TaxID=3028117 RepID=UPI0016855759|nr:MULTISPECIES: hypothetical protein [Cyanophyceae]MBD1917404.1 hypothetical protein [Phormidium sp. FACHB-77]MBD2032351.1 hypothetical protein [Phormidium sp. FACHB-322]MBD2052289.1 hypothetical protein [Leptolyngbya sp. FACHB-60]
MSWAGTSVRRLRLQPATVRVLIRYRIDQQKMPWKFQQDFQGISSEVTIDSQ